MLASSSVDLGFKPKSDYKDYKTGIDVAYWLSRHVKLRSKSNGWLVQNQDKVSVA